MILQCFNPLSLASTNHFLDRSLTIIDYHRHMPTSLQAHETAASFAAAYSLGKQESTAAVNLLRWVPVDIKDGLTTLVRPIVQQYVYPQ